MNNLIRSVTIGNISYLRSRGIDVHKEESFIRTCKNNRYLKEEVYNITVPKGKVGLAKLLLKQYWQNKI